jgi:hypothetical protein
MSKDSHPAIKQWAEQQGWSQDAEVDRDSFTGAQQYRMCLSSPASRMKALHDIDAAISAEDGQTLRSKSQLLELRRSLSVTHEGLLKAGR